MIYFTALLLVTASFCETSNAETCTIGEDGCSWECRKPTLKPGQVSCLSVPATPKTCVVGSSVSECGTTCTCTKSKAETCKVGEDGCTWDCRGPPPGAITCLALLATPETCVVGSSTSLCGTTCTCNKAKTCKVGENGCSWDCRSIPTKPGQVQCDAVPTLSDTCAVGSVVSLCATTCTCKQQEKCKVGENCHWNCVTMPSNPDMVQCAAVPNTPSECYIGETSSMCGTSCTCTASTRKSNFLDRIRELLVNFLRRILGLRVTSGDKCEQ